MQLASLPHQVVFADCAKGFVKENDIWGATNHGLVIGQGADPDVVGNKIETCELGMLVQAGGKGRHQNNKYLNNTKAGVVVEIDSDPDMRGNVCKENGEQGELSHVKCGEVRRNLSEVTCHT